MTKVHIEVLDEVAVLNKELKGEGVGEFYSLMIEDVEGKNDFTTGELLYTWCEPELDVAIIYNETHTVMIGQSFDIKGNLYRITWIKKEYVDLESMNGLDEFADWNKPYSIELVEED